MTSSAEPSGLASAAPREPIDGPVDGPGTTAGEFADWVRPHWPALHRLARRMCGPDAGDDVVQEALAAAWRSRARYEPARGSARTWLLAVVANEARKQQRRLRPVAPLTDDLATVEGADGRRVDLDAALRGLTERQRLTVTLHYYVDLPVADVAMVLGCAPGTVKSTLSDARRLIRATLGEDYA